MRDYKKRINFSITKYNPIYRNEFGHYQHDEWTSISDIGKSFEKMKPEIIISESYSYNK